MCGIRLEYMDFVGVYGMYGECRYAGYGMCVECGMWVYIMYVECLQSMDYI